MFVVCVGNFTPIVRYRYRIGVPRRCRYLEVLNTDATVYGGSGVGNMGYVEWEDIPAQGFSQSIVLTLPPLGFMYFVPELDADPPHANEMTVPESSAPEETLVTSRG